MNEENAEKQTLRRWYVLRDGFIVGNIYEHTEHEAILAAQRIHGPTAMLGNETFLNDTVDTVSHRMSNSSLMTLPAYRCERIVHSGPESLAHITLDNWLREHPGIFVVSIMDRLVGIPEDGEDIFLIFLVIYYRLIQKPTAIIIGEKETKEILCPNFLADELDFLYALNTKFESNTDLFEFARSQEIEWLPYETDPLKERLNCIYAIRKAKGWI